MLDRERFGKMAKRIGTNRRGTMSSMRNENKVIAIFLADIHLSLKEPIWRSAESDWLSAQARPLREVSSLQRKYQCPVICAGDIFDRNKKIADGWNAPPELINFAIAELPDNMYAIPGQHDLPNHQYDDIERSAYWTLVKAGKIENIPRNCCTSICDSEPSSGVRLDLFGFPPGYEIEPLTRASGKDCISIAVVHDYVWIKGYSYPDAPEAKWLGKKSLVREFHGYNVVVYGDNHKGFTIDGQRTIFNCGTLMRRKSDEKDYKPQVGLLLDNGSVVQHYLDTSEDKYIEKTEEQVKDTLDMGEFFEELEKLGKTALDFKEAVKEFLHSGGVSFEAKNIILKAMEE